MRRAGGAEVVRVRIAQLPSLTLALAAPLLVLLPAWSTLTTAPEWAPSKDVAEMNATATRAPAEVVMVGPSFARTDIDGPALGAALAASTPGHPLRVARFAQNLASAPAWYAILKERVYGNGLEPRLVLLVATTDYLLEVHPPASRMVGLEQHFAEPDEVLRARTWNSRLPATLQRALDRRRVLRDPVVSAFRDPLVEMFFGGKNGAELAAEAGVEVFGQEHGGGTRRLLPGVEAQAAEEASEGEVRAADSYLPDIAALVAQHGGRLVVVLPPVAASKAADHQVSAEAERDIVETANASASASSTFVRSPSPNSTTPTATTCGPTPSASSRPSWPRASKPSGRWARARCRDRGFPRRSPWFVRAPPRPSRWARPLPARPRARCPCPSPAGSRSPTNGSRSCPATSPPPSW